MLTFLALYRGRSVPECELVAVSASPELVEQVARRLLADRTPRSDPTLRARRAGERRALRLIVN